MADLIDRKDALNASKIVYIECIYVDEYGYEEGEMDTREVVFKSDILALPAVDAVEVKHGRWEVNFEPIAYCDDCVEVIYECSICGCEAPGESNFCPNCGADMREREEE